MVERQRLGPVLHLQRADQDQDRGADLPGQQAGAAAGRRCARLCFGLMTPEQLEQFQRELEIDFAISEPGLGRFRVNIFYQRGYPAMVLRYITADMPRLEALGLPDVLTRAGDAQARADPAGRGHRLGQVDHARGDDQPSQRERLRSHRHDRGSDRVPAHQQALDHQPARGRTRHQDLRARAARRDARGAGRRS